MLSLIEIGPKFRIFYLQMDMTNYLVIYELF